MTALVLVLVASVACLAHLWWRRDARLSQRALWSLALCVPLIGPLLYGALFTGLAPHDGVSRPKSGQGGIDYSHLPPPDQR